METDSILDTPSVGIFGGGLKRGACVKLIGYHTPMCHQLRAGPCGGTAMYIRREKALPGDKTSTLYALFDMVEPVQAPASTVLGYLGFYNHYGTM